MTRTIQPTLIVLAISSLTAVWPVTAQEVAQQAVANQETSPRVQRHTLSMQDSTTYTVTAADGVPEIPFRLVNNHLILPLSVNGSVPIDTVLDTGMPASGIALYQGPRTEHLELEFDPTMRAQVAGAGGGGKRIEARIVPDATLELEGLEIDGARIIAIPAMEDFGGYHDAIIGYSLFERFIVELDYSASVMRLHDPADYPPPSEAFVVPFELRQRLPFVTVQVTPIGEEPFAAEVVVDLGASHAISLNTESSDEIKVPETSLEAVLGRGLSGTIEGSLGRIASLGLGGAELTDVLASFPVSEHQHPRQMDSRAGNLGSEILRRFTTIFDYSRSRILLVPNPSLEEPFEWDHSGIRFGVGHELVVESLIASSPAVEAGVEIGDVLTHLDGDAVGPDDYGRVRDALTGDGEVRLTLQRGEETVEKTVVLRRLI